MKKGDHKPINVTQKSKHRIMVGLGWDPAENPSFWDQVKSLFKKKDHHHDLDLAALIFDADKNLIDIVSAETTKAIDASGKIYHSGDNAEGIGEGDDEEISAELIDMPDNIHAIIFTATIQTGHVFEEISDTHIRLADGYTNHNFIHQNMECDSGKEQNTYIFCRLYREGDGWMVHYIDEFTSIKTSNALGSELLAYL